MSIASLLQAAEIRRTRLVAVLATLLMPAVLSIVPLVSLTTTAARACACGCSVFDVGGGGLPQENDHGGRVFFEYWSGDQNQNWIGTSRAPASLNSDKNVNTQWYNGGFEYTFNRQWTVMARVPIVNRSFTTETDQAFPGSVNTFNSSSVGDIELMGMYTGFFNDMSTGLIFGIKLPTGTYTAPGFDRDTQIGSGSTDLLLGGFHRGMLSGDNAWQYFVQALWRQPFLYKTALDPQAAFDGNPQPNVPQSYYPGMQVDGAIGVLYNNWYNVMGIDKITPLAQLIMSHRNHDNGTGADPQNSGFDRVMISPGIEFTKVLDEANNRVLKTYFDIEIPVYYRTNAAPSPDGQGQLIAPYLFKFVTSYNF